MRATMLLCDAAQEANGKLYVLGGGWSSVLRPGPANMALAVKLDVPWNAANERHKLLARLVSEDGTPVLAEDKAIVAEGEFEIGRPPGIKPGSDLDVVFALPFAVVLAAGGYRWELLIDDKKLAEVSFRVLPGSEKS
jgi:hypothetical protein